MAETVTIGDTDVEIRETEDGFEAVEAEDEDAEGIYLRFVSSSGDYGAEIPIDADFEVREMEYRDGSLDESGNSHWVGFHTEDNVDDDLRSDGAKAPSSSDVRDKYGGHVDFASVEVVSR